MLNQKQDCIESLCNGLKSTSAWRAATSIRFPDDRRNIKASKALDQLAEEAANLTDEQWSELSSYYGSASQTWVNALNVTARSVGFHHRAGNLDLFITILVQNLIALSVAA